MKRTVTALFTGLLLSALLIPTGSILAQGEKHPQIRRAIVALQGAKEELEAASHDFCGHRKDAIEAINRAQAQLKLALGSDKAELAPAAGAYTAVAFFSEGGQDRVRERHPKIRQAIKILDSARVDLQKAAHDFNGHRAEALEATDGAIKQLGQALACDAK